MLRFRRKYNEDKGTLNIFIGVNGPIDYKSFPFEIRRSTFGLYSFFSESYRLSGANTMFYNTTFTKHHYSFTTRVVLSNSVRPWEQTCQRTLYRSFRSLCNYSHSSVSIYHPSFLVSEKIFVHHVIQYKKSVRHILCVYFYFILSFSSVILIFLYS